MDNLIDVEGLQDRIQSGDPDLVIVAVMPRCRFWRARVPGSQQVWRHQLSATGGHQLIDAAGFQAWARSLAVRSQSRIVLVDERYDAVRLWWAFQHYGISSVQVLNGGLGAWRRAGLALQRGPTLIDRLGTCAQDSRNSDASGSPLDRTNGSFPIATNQDVWRAEGSGEGQLWDCREPEEWRGQKRMRGASRAGRIPWSRHLCWREWRHGRDRGYAFRSDAELAAVVERHGIDPNKNQIAYCQSGVRSTTMLFALARLGWDPRRLFNHDGSWREWSRDRSLPIVCD